MTQNQQPFMPNPMMMAPGFNYMPNQGFNQGYVNQGFGYVERPNPKNTQPLTAEQISKLRQDANGFDWKIDQMDLWRATCTHKEKNGQPALVETSEGSGIYRCTICGATFPMCTHTVEEVQAAVNTIISMLQTAKSVYLDAPESLITNYFQVIPILEKFPMLWNRALDNYLRYENQQTATIPVYGNYGGFQALNNILAYNPMNFNNPQMGGYPQQGFYNPGYPMAPNPGVMPQGAPMSMNMPMDNPFGYGTAPAAPAAGMMPPQQPVAPAAPVATDEVVQQKTFNV